MIFFSYFDGIASQGGAFHLVLLKGISLFALQSLQAGDFAAVSQGVALQAVDQKEFQSGLPQPKNRKVDGAI